MKSIVNGLFVWLFFGASSGVAFELPEHKAITKRAILELSLCLPSPVLKGIAFRLVFFDRMEDLNLFRKWSRYSHYFDPDEPLQIRRSDASARLTKLETKESDGDTKDGINALGGAIHYLQDMASPPHVVPIKHGPLDNFEAFQDDDFFSQPVTKGDCEALFQEPKPTFVSLLQETARATLKTLPEKFSLSIDGASSRSSWEDFFLVSSFEKYGDYGSLGNNFGKEKFTVGVHTYEIKKEVYAAYKAKLLALAVSVTKRALYHYLYRPAAPPPS